MQVPRWLKSNSVYPRFRVAVLSLPAPRFYSMRSAIALFGALNPTLTEDESAIALREDGNLAFWQTPFGELATMRTDGKKHIDDLIREFKRNQYLYPPINLKAGSIVLDVGANIGLFTRQALARGARQVIALEPNPGTFEALQHNAADRRVTLFRKAAWHERTTLQFTVDTLYSSRSSATQLPPSSTVTQEISVEAVTIDNIVEDTQLPTVDFIKMDVEGAEIRALEGARSVLERFRPQLAIGVEHTADRLGNAARVRDLVKSINPSYNCSSGPYLITADLRLAPEVLYFT